MLPTLLTLLSSTLSTAPWRSPGTPAVSRTASGTANEAITTAHLLWLIDPLDLCQPTRKMIRSSVPVRAKTDSSGKSAFDARKKIRGRRRTWPQWFADHLSIADDIYLFDKGTEENLSVLLVMKITTYFYKSFRSFESYLYKYKNKNPNFFSSPWRLPYECALCIFLLCGLSKKINPEVWMTFLQTVIVIWYGVSYAFLLISIEYFVVRKCNSIDLPSYSTSFRSCWVKSEKGSCGHNFALQETN